MQLSPQLLRYTHTHTLRYFILSYSRCNLAHNSCDTHAYVFNLCVRCFIVVLVAEINRFDH